MNHLVRWLLKQHMLKRTPGPKPRYLRGIDLPSTAPSPVTVSLPPNSDSYIYIKISIIYFIFTDLVYRINR